MKAARRLTPITFGAKSITRGPTLYQYEIANGTDPDLKAFARETLPKIQDHLARALKLQGGVD
jgi:hypothetical protein